MSPAPSGLSNFVGGPTSGVRTGYSDKMAYDPASGRIFWIGCDHNQSQTFVQYDEAANAWTVLPTTPFAGATKHGYNHTTWDSRNNKLYHRPYGETAVRSWNGSSWTSHSYSSVMTYAAAAVGCEYFPDLGGTGRIMVFQGESSPNGELAGFDPSAGTWTTYASGTTLANTGDPHNFALYSPTHRMVVFGGGNGSNRVWRIDASGGVAGLANIPSALGEVGSGNSQSLAVCNPANGNILFIRNSSTWYELNPVANTWTQRSGTAQVLSSPIFDTSQPAWGTVAVPIHPYKVIVFIKGHSGTSAAHMWLYKP